MRGLAAADLDGDGLIEIVATTTQTQPTAAGGVQVFVFSADGRLFQPPGSSFPAWPRYNNFSGVGGDADRNGQGHSGYGCCGLNVGIGNIDDDGDDQLEIFVQTFDHGMDVFTVPGSACNCTPWPTARGGPLRMGQPNRYDL